MMDTPQAPDAPAPEPPAPAPLAPPAPAAFAWKLAGRELVVAVAMLWGVALLCVVALRWADQQRFLFPQFGP